MASRASQAESVTPTVPAGWALSLRTAWHQIEDRAGQAIRRPAIEPALGDPS
jgi:hypothetical protein